MKNNRDTRTPGVAMTIAERISPSRLREMVAYDPKSGILTRKTSNKNKTIPVGSVCNSVDRYGYGRLKLDGVDIRAHRAAWAIYFGVWPKNSIDHINGDKRDNRIANLREATNHQNAANRAPTSANTHGTKGVTRLPSGRWQAQICSHGKHRYLGSFADKGDAASAYNAAAKEVFGEFARPSEVRP